MKTLNLEARKVSASTREAINHFVYENKDVISIELKTYYRDVEGFISRELRKKASIRMSMDEILEKAYNIEKYVIKSGAASFETCYIKN